MCGHERKLASFSLPVEGKCRGPWSENANKPCLGFTHCLSSVCLPQRRSRPRGEEQGCPGQFTASWYWFLFLKQAKKKREKSNNGHRMISSKNTVNFWPPGETLGITWLCLKRGEKQVNYSQTQGNVHGGARMYTVHTSCVSAWAQAHTKTRMKKEKVHYNATVDGRPLSGP